MNMKRLLLFAWLVLAGCATLGEEFEKVEKNIWLIREQVQQGIVVYKTPAGNPDPYSVVFQMGPSGQVDMTVKYQNFTFVYGLGLKYEEKTLSSETREAKIMFQIKDFKFLSSDSAQIALPKSEADELIKHDQIKLNIIEKAKNRQVDLPPR
jgi:hypothetical protein